MKLRRCFLIFGLCALILQLGVINCQEEAEGGDTDVAQETDNEEIVEENNNTDAENTDENNEDQTDGEDVANDSEQEQEEASDESEQTEE